MNNTPAEELRAQLKQKAADVLVLQRQSMIDQDKIDHLINKIETLTETYDRERAPDMLRTIERLNRKNSSLLDDLGLLQKKYDELHKGFKSQQALMTRLDRKHQYQYEERCRWQTRCEILQSTLDRLNAAAEKVQFRDIMETKPHREA